MNEMHEENVRYQSWLFTNIVEKKQVFEFLLGLNEDLNKIYLLEKHLQV